MTHDTAAELRRPADMVENVVAAFAEVWRSRGMPPALLGSICEFAREEAETRLRDASARDATSALVLAWGVAWLVLERHMEHHRFLKSTINEVIGAAGEKVSELAASDGGP
ncbi:hypothetical protein [Actinomadura rubrisoli]|uniref:Uncharacterized protein n=1 Tax=Actinomadura rubrisoli TaxID=2530368 RepID=A0A4R5BL13_9ACTN|nr:hypothetical protein [Actinomadura rubrisoli]TDD85926.1 hypothetical protein E1298_18055 [Actinomadura rubrisoli]